MTTPRWPVRKLRVTSPKYESCARSSLSEDGGTESFQVTSTVRAANLDGAAFSGEGTCPNGSSRPAAAGLNRQGPL